MHANLNDVFNEELSETLETSRIARETFLALSRSARSDAYRDAVGHYLEQSRDQVARLESLLSERDGDGATESAAQALRSATVERAERFEDRATREAALVCQAHKLVHLQIASYGTLCAWARTLDRQDAVAPLKACLSEAKGVDQQLSRIALEYINEDAV